MKGNEDKRLLVGLDSRDDAGVFAIGEDLALVQTVDFFTPIVDDPYDYGQIAAANALSDAYAMGARPVTALNVVGFPASELDKEVLSAILEGGWHKAQEAGVTVVGGHSVKDAELKYGMAVTALIAPGDIVRNNAARPGDQLILTKPIGTGILTTALKNGTLAEADLAVITASMKTLNRDASQAMLRHGATACTDVTGYGLLGHLYEMTMETEISAVVHAAQVPLFAGTLALSAAGKVPGGLRTNRGYVEAHLQGDESVQEALVDVLCDPQTSGGLLFAVPGDALSACLATLEDLGVADAAHIGEIVTREEKAIRLR